MSGQKTNIKLNHRPSLSLSAISNCLSLVINVIITFYLVPVVIDFLGKTNYGYWILMSSVVGYYGLINLGISSAVSRYIARYRGMGDVDAMNGVYSTAMMFFIVTGLIVVLVSVLLSEPLTVFFNITQGKSETFKNVILLLGISTAFAFPSGVLVSVVVAHERFFENNIMNIIRVSTKGFLTILLLNLDYGLIGMAYVNIIITLLSLVLCYVIIRIYIPWVNLRIRYVSPNVLKKLFKFGSGHFIMSSAGVLRTNLDSFVVGKWVSMASISIYSIPGQVINHISQVINAVLGVLAPRFALLDGAKEKKQLYRLFQNGLLISSYFAFGAFIFIFIFGEQFIILWVGDQFRDAHDILMILGVCNILSLSQNPAYGLMLALNRHYTFSILSVCEAVVNVLLSILLAIKYGIIGVALGTFIPMIVIKVGVQPIYICKVTGISLAQYLKPIIIPGAISVTFVLWAHLMKYSLIVSQLKFFSLGLHFFLMGIIYSICVYFCSLWAGLDVKHNKLFTKINLLSKIKPESNL